MRFDDRRRVRVDLGEEYAARNVALAVDEAVRSFVDGRRYTAYTDYDLTYGVGVERRRTRSPAYFGIYHRDYMDVTGFEISIPLTWEETIETVALELPEPDIPERRVDYPGDEELETFAGLLGETLDDWTEYMPPGRGTDLNFPHKVGYTMFAGDVDLGSLDNEELHTLVAEREDYIEDVTEFVRDAALEYGTMTSRKEGGYGYRTQWQLDGFHDLDLLFHSKVNSTYSVQSGGETVLEIHEIETADSFSVETYTPGEWVNVFDELVADPESAFERYEAGQEIQEARQERRKAERQREREREREREALLEAAERLGLE